MGLKMSQNGRFMFVKTQELQTSKGLQAFPSHRSFWWSPCCLWQSEDGPHGALKQVCSMPFSIKRASIPGFIVRRIINIPNNTTRNLILAQKYNLFLKMNSSIAIIYFYCTLQIPALGCREIPDFIC